MTKHLRTAALSTLAGGALAALGLLLGPAGSASAADVTIHLDATTGTTPLPTKTGTPSLDVLGYCQRTAAGTPCGTVTRPGGPTLTVDAGDRVTITLHNELTDRFAEATSLYVGGQQIAPDTTGADAGASAIYTFIASRPGTYLYEAGLTANHQHQVALGLYGALVVRPSVAGQAYDDSATAYETEQVMVVSEVDPALNTSAAPAQFDMRAFAARYTLINGKVHSATDPVTAAAGDDVLLRWVNAGTQYHSMTVLGAEQRIVAYDGSRLLNDGGALDISRRLVADTFGPGQTADAIVTVPSSPTARKLPVYDASLTLHNTNAAGIGGALTFIQVGANGASAGAMGPVTSKVAYDVATGTLSAVVSDATTGGSAVQAVEYLVDTTAGTGTGTALAPGSAADSYSVAYLVPSGQHVVYVHGQDAEGTWGPWSSVLVQGSDAVGPTTTALSLAPERTNGSAEVTLSATGDDSASGNSAIKSAEWSIDGGAYQPMTVETSGPVASLTATIPSSAFVGLASGLHDVSVRSTDSADNVGEPSVVQLVLDREAPTAGDVSVTPNPNNGNVPVNGSSPAVRVLATITDPAFGPPTNPVQGSVDKAEAFLETPVVDGTGIPMEAADGAFSSPAEAVYLDIPLATVRLLSEGQHTIAVHGHDAAGNWGPATEVQLIVDKTAPVISGLSVTPSPTAGAATVTLQGTVANDPSGLPVIEWFAGTDPGVGKGTPITRDAITGAVTATIDTASLSDGTVVLSVRAKDGAGNVTVGKVSVVVTHSLWYATVATPPVGVSGTARDVYRFDGATTARTLLPGLPANANVDAFSRVDATHYYVSFSNAVTVPGIGRVQPRDVLYRDGNRWVLFLDGSRRGIRSANVDAIDVVGGRLYLSVNDTRIPGSTSTRGSQSDIYRWNGGTSFTRVLDTSTIGIPDTANVDGFNWLGGSNWAFSFAATNSTVTGFALVPDEDVVVRRNGVWSTWFDGSAHGLTTTDNNRDLEGFTLP